MPRIVKREMSFKEATSNLRAILILTERLFVEGNPNTETEEHRKLAVESCTWFLQK